MKPSIAFLRLFSVPVLLFSHSGLNGAPAGALADPTRPPSFAADAADGEKSEPTRVVQSVLIAPGRTMAVIDGATVRVGSSLGGAKVVKIDETGVILSNSGKLEVLKLFPDAGKSVPGRARR